MTTLELARLIAAAALVAPAGREGEAVLAALEANGCWFCRLEDRDDVTIQDPFPPATLPFDTEPT